MKCHCIVNVAEIESDHKNTKQGFTHMTFNHKKSLPLDDVDDYDNSVYLCVTLQD